MKFACKPPCTACSIEVRGLYASASNAVSAWESYRLGFGNLARFVRRAADLGESVGRFRPIVEAHFADVPFGDTVSRSGRLPEFQPEGGIGGELRNQVLAIVRRRCGSHSGSAEALTEIALLFERLPT